MDSPHQLGEGAKTAQQRIVSEVIQPATTADAITPIKLDDYKAFCHERLDMNTALSNDVLKQTTDYIGQDSKLKQHFAPGYTYSVVVMPCNTYGSPLEDEEVKKGAHVRTFIINQQGQTVAGLPQKVTHLFNVLPPEVQANTFTIPGYANPDRYTITPEDRAMVTDLYTKSFQAAKKLLS